MKPAAFDKYRRRNPAPVFPGGRDVLHVVVIPAYNETAELPGVLSSLAVARSRFSEPVAVLVVINYPAGAGAGESLELRAALDRPQWRDRGVYSLWAPELAGGVGAARKLGMDSALSAWDADSVESAIIYSLDADSPVDPEYFTVISATLAAHPGAGGITVGVRHRAGETPEMEAAIRSYEAYLDSYVSGLRRAGSPYAFSSIGSAFAVRGGACIRAGGMKVRAAGEDFYFLQEVAKTSGIVEERRVLVYPSPRCSDRVPFGTGVAVSRLMAGHGLNEVTPAAFEALRNVLAAASRPDLLESAGAFLAELPEPARRFFETNRFPRLWPQIIANQPDRADARREAFDRWFDGLRTLRFLHFMSGGVQSPAAER